MLASNGRSAAEAKTLARCESSNSRRRDWIRSPSGSIERSAFGPLVQDEDQPRLIGSDRFTKLEFRDRTSLSGRDEPVTPGEHANVVVAHRHVGQTAVDWTLVRSQVSLHADHGMALEPLDGGGNGLPRPNQICVGRGEIDRPAQGVWSLAAPATAPSRHPTCANPKRSAHSSGHRLKLPNATWMFRRTYSVWAHDKGVPAKVVGFSTFPLFHFCIDDFRNRLTGEAA